MKEKSKGLLAYLKDALGLVTHHPKLFLPKMVVAGFYGLTVVMLPPLISGITKTQSIVIAAEQRGFFSTSEVATIQQLAIASIIWLIVFLTSFLFDIIVSAMYPSMVKQALDGKTVGVKDALKYAVNRWHIVIPALIAAVVLMSIPLAAAYNMFGRTLIEEMLSGINPVLIIYFTAMLVAAFVIMVMLYFVWPVSTLRAKSPLDALSTTVKVGKKRRHIATKAALIPFAIGNLLSILSIVTAFFITNVLMLMMFVLLRIGIGAASAIHLVLVATIYLEGNGNG